MSSDAPETAPNPAPIVRVSDPYPHDRKGAEGRGVEPQSTPALDDSAANNGEAQNGAANSPAWAPPLPTEVQSAPWESLGRPPTTAEQWQELDTPARSPNAYTLPPGFLGDDVGAEALTHGAAVQSLLHSAGFPAHEGAGLLHDVAESERMNPDGLSELDFEVQAQSTEATLRRVLGSAEFERQRAALTEMLADMDRKSGGKLGEFIEEHADHLASPMVYARLLAHAGRVATRRRR